MILISITKIKGSFQFQQKNSLIAFEDKLQVSSRSNSSDYLPNVINILLSSTVKKLICDVSYFKSSDTKPTSRRVEPIGLFYESGFWYVLVFCHLRKDYRNFRLDRIKKVSLLEETFTLEHPTVEQIRNAGSAAKTIKIRIKVDRRFAHYLFWERQNYGFVTEDVREAEVFMEFICEGHPTSFVRWFMKFVDFGEIIEPAYLKNELRNILNVAINKHTI